MAIYGVARFIFVCNKKGAELIKIKTDIFLKGQTVV